MSIRFPKPARRLLGLLLACSLAACGGGVGSGNGPTMLKLLPFGGAIGDATTKAYECIPTVVQALLYFNDGSVGDFTGRAVFTSSSPGVAVVSDGTRPINGLANTFYPRGILVPTGPGTTTITANYQGLTASIVVNVGTPSNFTIKHVIRSIPQVPPNNGIRIGVGTLEDYTVTAFQDGIERNVESANNLVWSIDGDNSTIATVTNSPGGGSANGLIAGVAPGGPLTLRATFPSCNQTVATTFSVANVAAISVAPEFTGNPNLIVGNTEQFLTFADFGNGPEQDISKLVTYTSSSTATLAFGGILSADTATAVAAGGPVAVSANFLTGGSSLTSPTLNVTTVTDTLQSIAVTPKTASLVASSTQLAQFKATGTYASGTKQDVTRGVTFTLDNSAIGVISNATDTAGFAVSAGSTQGTTTITATSTVATVGTTDTATLTTTGP